MIREIQTRSEIERRRTLNKRIASIVMFLLLVTSTLGFAFLSYSSSNSNINNNGANTNHKSERAKTDGISFQYRGEKFMLISSYFDIENVSVDSTISLQSYSGEILYVDSGNQGVLQEIVSTVGKSASRVQRACYGKCEEDLPEKNCTNYLIIWRESNENKVYQNNKCVFIEGDMKAADAFIYRIFGSP